LQNNIIYEEVEEDSEDSEEGEYDSAAEYDSDATTEDDNEDDAIANNEGNLHNAKRLQVSGLMIIHT